MSLLSHSPTICTEVYQWNVLLVGPSFQLIITSDQHITIQLKKYIVY